MSYLSTSLKDDGQFVLISGFSINIFKRDLNKIFKTSRIIKIFDLTFSLFGRGTIRIHKFFLPELVYIFSKLPPRSVYSKTVELILDNTWMKEAERSHTSRINSFKITSDFTFSLKSYQKKFIDLYDDIKQKYSLNGYILSFEQGLGKTFTSIALMHGLNKDSIIIIAPKTTIKTVWKNEIQTVFKNKQDVWIVGDQPKKAKFYIVNYESISKLKTVMSFILSKNIGIIVDESHNFKDINAKRVTNLLIISKVTKCKDILLMSGTPIKAMGSEMIPYLSLLDPLFDKFAKDKFIKIFGLNTLVAIDVLKNRLGYMMHRKLKQEVEILPKKEYKEIKIKIPDSDKYNLESVKYKVSKFILERQAFYKSKFKTFENDYNECIDFLSKDFKNDKSFINYLNIINTLKKYGYDSRNKQLVQQVKWINDYEKNVIRSKLPNDLKRKFDKSKSVVKYLNLKIMGEVIGGLLNKLRSEMFAKMIQNSPTCSIINNSKKKTVLFSTFVDVVKEANNYINKICKNSPILIFGETSGNIKDLLYKFKSDTLTNPLIATIQTMSTGVTLIEANTVIFLNQPWRHVDKIQAEDRVHRIGQDTDVMIYTYILDTGNKPNLSTRMEDIISWSKEMFEGIVGKEEVKKL